MADSRTREINEVVRVAKAEVSKSSAESPRGSNRTKYGKWYGVDGVPWCAIGVTWVFAKAGLEVGIYGPRTAWVPDYRAWGRARGRWSSGKSDVRVGDIVCFRNGQHVEIVVRKSGSRFWTVGFNTSWKGVGGSFADGVYVAENERTHDTVDGTLHPFYGVSEAAVKLAQEAAGVKVDGDLGPKSLAAIKVWQKANGLEADGIPGADTYAKLKGGVAVSKPVAVKPATKPAAKPATKPAAKPVKKPVAVKAPEADGRFGHDTVKVLQRWLNKKGANLKVDGKAGHEVWEALQHVLKAPYKDGKIDRQSHRAESLGNGITQGWKYTGPNSKGSQTVELLQKLIGVKVDGVWGEKTTLALQLYLGMDAG